jgi:hypothetical protein
MSYRPPTRRELAEKGSRVLAVLERIGACAMGESEMTKAQLTAAQLYLRKYVPDLTSVAHSGHIEDRAPTREELIRQGEALGLSPDVLFDDGSEPIEGPGSH